jgi:hypothetical protein
MSAGEHVLGQLTRECLSHSPDILMYLHRCMYIGPKVKSELVPPSWTACFGQCIELLSLGMVAIHTVKDVADLCGCSMREPNLENYATWSNQRGV